MDKSRRKVWLIYLRVTLQQIKIDNVFTVSYATNKVFANNLEVSDQLETSA